MPSTSETARQYACSHAERFRQEMHELLRIPSLSGDPAYAADVRHAATWLGCAFRSS